MDRLFTDIMTRLRKIKPDIAIVTVRDCRGRSVRTETRDLAAGVHAFEVPASGLLEIRHQAAK